MTISIEELARDVRGFVERAAAGEVLEIVEAGNTVARLVSESAVAARLLSAAAKGQFVLPASGPRKKSREIRAIKVDGKPLSQMVIEDRR